jgi:hypothetical protein
MINLLHTILFAIYCAIFPWLFEEHLEPLSCYDGMADDTRILRTAPHWSLERAGPWFRLNLYNPLFRPVFWWRHTKFLNEALEQAQWVDPDS